MEYRVVCDCRADTLTHCVVFIENKLEKSHIRACANYCDPQSGAKACRASSFELVPPVYLSYQAEDPTLKSPMACYLLRGPIRMPVPPRRVEKMQDHLYYLPSQHHPR